MIAIWAPAVQHSSAKNSLSTAPLEQFGVERIGEGKKV